MWRRVLSVVTMELSKFILLLLFALVICCFYMFEYQLKLSAERPRDTSAILLKELRKPKPSPQTVPDELRFEDYFKSLPFPESIQYAMSSSRHASKFSRQKRNKTCFMQIQVWLCGKMKDAIFQRGNITEYECPGLECGIRHIMDCSVQTMKKSDVVVFAPRSTRWDWREVHENRPVGQKWVFHHRESPERLFPWFLPPPQYYNNSYDYIMSYRTRETSFYASYGYYDPRKPDIAENDERNWAGNKTQLVAFFVSNCDGAFWDRIGFAKMLSRYITVNKYGACFNNDICPKHAKAGCMQNILRSHKFYLALENSECRDYITEKLWWNSYLSDMVPIVYGPPREDYELVAPPNSFIHVQDFKSLRELADYLLLLDSNDDLYNKYFDWRKRGTVRHTGTASVLGAENLCNVVGQVLEDKRAIKEGRYTKRTLPDWNSWFTGSCQFISGVSNF